MKPLINFTAKYFLIAFALAGALYLTFSLGRMYEVKHDDDILFATCTPTGDEDWLDCELYEVKQPLAEIYKNIFRELREPTTKEELKQDYADWEKGEGI